MLQRSTGSRLQTLSIAKSSRALLACAVTAGLSFQAATHPAQAEEAVSAEAYLADLVNQLSSAKSAVSNMELEMGGLREGANKARVELTDAQKKAQKAQDDVDSARGRLTDSDEAVAGAQKDLDEIARSAYTAGGDASPVTLAAGGDIAADTLDRSSYIRLATERQENTVNRLDLARTQTANEESRLRDNRNTADTAVSDAVRLYNDARKALRDAQSLLSEKRDEYDRLVKDRDKAQKRLDAARSAVDTLANTKPDATSFEKRRVAEAAANKAADKVEKASDAAPAGQAPALGQAPAQQQAPDRGAATDTEHGEDAQSGGASTADTAAKDSDDALPAPAADAPGAGASGADAANAPSAPAAGAGTAGAGTATAGAGIEPYAGETTGPAAPAGSTEALPELNNVATEFAASSEGDQQRQLAINGLLNAGGQAALAGFTTYAQGGDQAASLNAALTAGRDAAGREYDGAQAQLNPSTGAPTEPPAPGTATPGTTPEGTAPEGTTPGTTTPTTPAPGADSGVDTSGTAEQKIERVIERGMSQLGVTYAWGGGNAYGPTLGIRDGGVADTHGDYNKIGFDCSGLTLYAFAAVGITLDHYSGNQYNAGRQVPASEAKRGDLLFWGPGGSLHVAIYLGNGEMLEAPQSGSSVKVSPVRWDGMTPNAVRLIE